MQLTKTVVSDSAIFIEKKTVENRLCAKRKFYGQKNTSCAAPRDVAVACAGGAGSSQPSLAARTGALPPGMWPWPAPAALLQGLARFWPGSFVFLLYCSELK